MNRELVKEIILSSIILLSQLLIFNHINLFETVDTFIYVSLFILYKTTYDKTYLIFLQPKPATKSGGAFVQQKCKTRSKNIAKS